MSVTSVGDLSTITRKIPLLARFRNVAETASRRSLICASSVLLMQMSTISIGSMSGPRGAIVISTLRWVVR